MKNLNNIISSVALTLALTLSTNLRVNAGEPILGLPGEEATCIGILVRDIASGDTIADLASAKNYVPASVMKLVTTASAMSLLPSDFRFETAFDLTGTRSADKSTLNGNIVVVSCGDPTFDSTEFSDYAGSIDSVVVNLKRLGITKINGSVVIKQDMSDQGPIVQWEIDDVAWGYGAGLFGMNYRDNTFTLWPATGKTSPEIPGLELVKTSTKDSNNLVRGIGSDKLYVYSCKLADRRYSMTSTMPDPSAVYANELTKALRYAGITITGRTAKTSASDTTERLYTHRSPLLHDILSSLMVNSNNLFAEGMLRAIAPKSSRTDAIKRCKELWQNRGIESRYVTIKDGSGLARVDRLSPRFITDVLTYMAGSDMSADYVACFPKTGVNGTVKRLLAKTHLEGKLALKSGSMNGVICYAGYKLNDEGIPTHTVVILVNSYFCTSAQLREKIENYLLNTFPPEETECDSQQN